MKTSSAVLVVILNFNWGKLNDENIGIGLNAKREQIVVYFYVLKPQVV
jgi:hypothetical protein